MSRNHSVKFGFGKLSTALTIGLFASAMLAPALAHAKPTVEFVQPTAGATVPAGTNTNIMVKVTGPANRGGTLTLQFPTDPSQQAHKKSIILDDDSTEVTETFSPTKPSSPGTVRACASVMFGGNDKSDVVCIEWRVK